MAPTEQTSSLVTSCDVGAQIGEACLGSTTPLSVGTIPGAPTPVNTDTVYVVKLGQVGDTSVGSLAFAPPVAGDYTLLLGTPNMTLVLRDEQGQIVPAQCSDTRVRLVCTLFKRGLTFALQAGHSYTLELARNAPETWVRVALFGQDTAGDFADRYQVLTSDPTVNQELGQALAASQDTLAVGARAPGGPQGQVIVYSRSTGQLLEEARMQPASWNTPTLFGSSVALDGDLLVVGAPYDDSTLADQDRGSAYVYRRSAGSWLEIAHLLSPNAERRDYFGHRVAVHDDLIAISAIGEDSASLASPTDNSKTDSGAVYLYRVSAAEVSFEAYLKAQNADASDAFGSSLDVSDGIVAVGAQNEDSDGAGVDPASRNNGRPNSGAVYVFERVGSAWAQTHFLKASNPDSGDVFGAALSFGGSLLLVGAPAESGAGAGVDASQLSNTAPGAGAAYLFDRSSNTYTQRTYLKALNAAAGQNFGGSVSVRNGVVIVGAVGEASSGGPLDPMPQDTSATLAGAAYVFRVSARVTQDALLKAEPALPFRRFGKAVASAGNWVAAFSPPASASPSSEAGGSVRALDVTP